MSEDTGQTDDRTQTGAPLRSPEVVVRRVFSRREAGVFFGFVVLYGLIALTRPDLFFDWESITGVTARLFRTASLYVIIGIGMGYLIIGGEFDLSVGSMFAVGGLLFAMLIESFNVTVAASMVAVLLVAAGIGATNGLVVTKVGVPSLIATIGMLSILRGVALYITPGGGRSVPHPEESRIIELLGGNVELIGITVTNQVFWALGLFVVFGIVLQRTRFGYHVYSVGDDRSAAERTGIDPDRVKMISFILTAVLAAFAGMIAISYYGSMFGTAGQGYELLIIAAVVIGGTNLFGGEGTLSGMALGALVIAIIPIVLVLNGFAVEIQELLTGIVIILAVVLDILFRGR